MKKLSVWTRFFRLKTRLSPDEFGADTRLAASRRAGWQSAMVARGPRLKDGK